MTNSGTVTHVDTSKIHSAMIAFREGIKEYNEIKTDGKHTTTKLLLEWNGKARNQFKKNYATIYTQLTDLEDILNELYNALMDAESEYLSADGKLVK